MLDEQGHLECEIEELRLEIKDNAERIDKLCNILKQNNEKLRKLKEMNDAQRNTNEAVENKLKEQINKLENKNWNVNINHRTPYKPQVEYYDEQTVIINGVQYQRVEPPKPQTLYDSLYEKGNMYSSVCDTVVEIVERWLPDKVMLDEEEPLSVMMDYRTGWNNCIKYLKENLK
jgi:uncharacterized iron-regulated protein